MVQGQAWIGEGIAQRPQLKQLTGSGDTFISENAFPHRDRTHDLPSDKQRALPTQLLILLHTEAMKLISGTELST